MVKSLPRYRMQTMHLHQSQGSPIARKLLLGGQIGPAGGDELTITTGSSIHAGAHFRVFRWQPELQGELDAKHFGDPMPLIGLN